jgi:hypothetical protein
VAAAVGGAAAAVEALLSWAAAAVVRYGREVAFCPALGTRDLGVASLYISDTPGGCDDLDLIGKTHSV